MMKYSPSQGPQWAQKSHGRAHDTLVGLERSAITRNEKESAREKTKAREGTKRARREREGEEIREREEKEREKREREREKRERKGGREK